MGWVYNLEKPDPHSEFGQVIAICVVFMIAALLAVALRFYIRIHTKRSLWLDDYAALYSALMVTGYGVSSVYREWFFYGGWEKKEKKKKKKKRKARSLTTATRDSLGSRSSC